MPENAVLLADRLIRWKSSKSTGKYNYLTFNVFKKGNEVLKQAHLHDLPESSDHLLILQVNRQLPVDLLDVFP